MPDITSFITHSPFASWLIAALASPQAFALACALTAALVCGLAIATSHQYSRRDGLKLLGLLPVMALAWVLAAYSLAFTYDTPWLGGLDKAGGYAWSGLLDATPGTGHERAPALSERSHVWFELIYALAAWGVALWTALRRMSVLRAAVLSVAWLVLVYAPVAHWAWHPDGFLAHIGLVDAAGALVVHLTSAASAVAMFMALGRGPGAPAVAGQTGLTALSGRRLLVVACAGWLLMYASWAVASGADERTVIAAGIVAAIAAAATARVLLGRHRPVSVSGANLSAVAAFAAVGAGAGHWPLLPALAAGGLVGLVSGATWAWCAPAVSKLIGQRGSPWMSAHLIGAVVGVLVAPLVALALGQAQATTTVPAVWQALAGPIGVICVLGYAWLVTFALARLVALPRSVRAVTPVYSIPISAIEVHTPAATTKWSST